jgi:hypothetical protein
MKLPSPTPSRCRRWVSPSPVLALALLACAAIYFFLLPGLTVLADLGDDGLAGPGVSRKASRLHRDLSPRIRDWARERVASGRAATVALHDVPSTEWPMFSAVFYLMATDELQKDWDARRHYRVGDPSPRQYAAEAIVAARDLIVDPRHHTWVRTHWGDDYLHRQNVFFRSLLIAGLTSYEDLTHDGTSLPMLRDQVETLAKALDESRSGVLEDYPGECYPIDVLAGVAFIRRADPVLGTDHSAFVARSVRGFQGRMADRLGLVPYRVDVSTDAQLEPSRGVGNSWVGIFAPDLWPEQAKGMYARYEGAFWEERWWAEGFREYARGTPDSAWLTEVDAGPVLDGLGTAANAFGVAAARKNGRFDHAYALSAELIAASWPLADGTLLLPRALSSATDAPYLGEAGVLYMLTVQPAAGVPVVTGGHVAVPSLVWLCLLVYFGVPFAAGAGLARAVQRRRGSAAPAVPAALGGTYSRA